MIRNRLATGVNPIGSTTSSRSQKSGVENESDENEGLGIVSGTNHSNSNSGNRDWRQQELFLSKGGITNENSKEKHETIGCCNRRQRKHLWRSIVAALLFVVFGIHRIVPSNDVVSPNFSPSPPSYPASGTFRNRGHVTEPNATNTTNEFLVVPQRSGSTPDRYKPRKIIHSLPTNPSDYSAIETMVLNHQKRDKPWYKLCTFDNATAWTANMRANGGEIGKFFNRACPNTGGHPQGVHWNPFRTPDHDCSVTSRIDLRIERDHFWEDWRIQTMDAKGVPKTVGGDTFYIVYSEYFYGNDGPVQSDHPPMPTAVAIPTDYYNGTYRLDFVSVPFLDPPSMISKHDGQRKKGKLTIHAITTCFIGTVHPPFKDGWKTGGQTNATWTIENVDRPYKIQDWYTDRYFPQQHAEKLDPRSKVRNSLSGFDRVAFAGDSMLTHMVWDIFKNDYHSIVTDKIHSGTICNGSTQKDGSPSVFSMPLSTVTLPAFLEALDPWIRGGLNDNDNDNDNDKNNDKNNAATADDNTNSNMTKKALVLGSAAWDIIWPAEWQGANFENHLSALEELLKHLRKAHPGIALIWKLPYAQQMHNANPDVCFADPVTSDYGSCVQALRYATSERFDKLYQVQKQFIETKFGGDNMVFLLDLYEISYLAGSYWMVHGDSIHYMPSFNALVLERLLYAEPA